MLSLSYSGSAQNIMSLVSVQLYNGNDDDSLFLSDED